MSSIRALRPAVTLNGLRQAAIRSVGASPSYSIAAALSTGVSRSRLGHGAVAAALPRGTRRYSQQSETKIWSFEEVQKIAKQSQPETVIVDVREPGELQSTGHIPHAVNIPVTSAPDSFHIPADEFEDRFGFPRPAKDREVVFYCKAGVRSRAAAGLARDAGWTRVGEYPGSWLDWAGKGGEVER